MARLRKKHLPHPVDLLPLEGEGARGLIFGDKQVDVPAYVEQKTRRRIDRRAGSATIGQEISSSTLVILLPEHDVAPRTRVTVWKGTPRERTSEVIDSAFFQYRGAPSHVELFLE